MSRTVRALASGIVNNTALGLRTVVHEGELFEANDPLVKEHPWMFEKITRDTVEQATAAPGEKRTTRRVEA